MKEFLAGIASVFLILYIFYIARKSYKLIFPPPPDNGYTPQPYISKFKSKEELLKKIDTVNKKKKPIIVDGI